MLTLQEFQFSRKPWTTTTSQETPLRGKFAPATRKLLGMKPGESCFVEYNVYMALKNAAYRRSIDFQGERSGKRYKFTRLA